MGHNYSSSGTLAGIRKLADALGIPVPTIADRRMLPKGLVLQAAEIFEVSLRDGTAEQQLRELIELAGLVDATGKTLDFRSGSSAYLAPDIAKIIQKHKNYQSRIADRHSASRIALADSRETAAETKIEAVNRISQLTNSGPETLGPGSKERKSVLINLHRGLGFGDAPHVSKSELGRRIAEKLGTRWGYECYSSGESITLEGLNRLLFAAERELDQGKRRLTSISDEAKIYAGAILQSIINTASIDKITDSAAWTGKSAVEEMLATSYPHARQTEWPGWYFEYKALTALMKDFGGGPERVGTTSFDYKGKRLWDLKTHAAGKVIPLNDKASTIQAIDEQGLGFIILSGAPSYENEDEFYNWHSTTVRGNPPKPRARKSRRLKTAFTLRHLDFFFIRDHQHRESLEDGKILTDFAQGRQQSGALRPMKYKMSLAEAKNSNAHVYSVDIKEYISSLNSPKRNLLSRKKSQS